MPRHKSALTALKNLAKSYEEERKRLLRKAEDEMGATVEKIVGNLASIAKDFPTVVSNAVSTLILAPTAQAVRKVASATAATKDVEAAATNDAPADGQEAGRFRAMGVKAHRTKLEMSAKDYGQLVGVSEVTIYKWESGKNKPQAAQKAKWLAIRGLGKEEALERLGTVASKAGPAKAAKPVAAKAAAPKAAVPKKQKRGQFTETAEQMILSLLKGKKATTGEIHVAWQKAGRGVGVDQTLSKMVSAKKLSRKSLGGKKGSEYSVA